MRVEELSCERSKIEKEIADLGEYTGQCLHKTKKMCTRYNRAWYDSLEEFYVCSVCEIPMSYNGMEVLK